MFINHFTCMFFESSMLYQIPKKSILEYAELIALIFRTRFSATPTRINIRSNQD